LSELTGPRQVVLVTSRHGGKDNIITLAWHMPTSFNPLMYAISVGKSRASRDMIAKSGVFCVNFMPSSEKNAMEVCGSVSGREHDKFGESGLGKEECGKIDCPRIRQALGFMECRVAGAAETGDHTIFIGKVVNSGLRGKGRRLYHITGSKFTTAAGGY
jgi:flavin reductase (DIM6/NTAB) family NADH-FMN oxidoreductase RutF